MLEAMNFEALSHASGNVGSNNAWSSTIALLKPPRLPAAFTDYHDEEHPHTPVVAVIERPTARTAIVSWRDSTRCSYGDQLWVAGWASESGTCALSGEKITRLDPIFRPQRMRQRPLNAEAMISAYAMEKACDLTEVGLAVEQ